MKLIFGNIITTSIILIKINVMIRKNIHTIDLNLNSYLNLIDFLQNAITAINSASDRFIFLDDDAT